jgi:hypothetical protein
MNADDGSGQTRLTDNDANDISLSFFLFLSKRSRVTIYMWTWVQKYSYYLVDRFRTDTEACSPGDNIL